MGIFVPSYIYLVYGKQDAKGKLLMAIFSPLIDRGRSWGDLWSLHYASSGYGA